MTLVIVAPLLALSYHGVLHRLPFGSHPWAQADRLALAMRFTESDRGLLDPATYSLFDHDGRVAVELPLQAWTAAEVSRLPGFPDVVTLFRLLDIALFALGLASVARLTARFTQSLALAILPALVLATSPLLVRYSGTFLPDPAAFALFMVGIERFFAFAQTRRGRTFVAAMLLLTLAAHLKMSFALYLPGIGIHALALTWGRPRGRREAAVVGAVVASLAISLASLVAGYALIRWRGASLGSGTFTTRLHPFESLAELLDVTRRAVLGHAAMVHSPWLLLGLAVAVGCLLAARTIGSPPRLLVLQWGNAVVGGVALYLLLGRQYVHHDYYLLACAYPTLMLTLVVVANRLDDVLRARRGARRRLAVVPVAVTLLCVPSLLHRLEVERRADWLPGLGWLDGARELLDSTGVGSRAPVVVYFDGGPNLPLVYLRRPGYVVHADQRGRRQLAPSDLPEFMEDRDVHWLLIPETDATTLPPEVLGSPGGLVRTADGGGACLLELEDDADLSARGTGGAAVVGSAPPGSGGGNR